MFNNIYKNKKVLITGHTGFKGTWLTSWLLNLESDVAGYSDCVPTIPSHFNELKIENKIGIKSRHIANNETSLDLAYNSSLKVLKSTKDKNIDFILYCTQTPDYILPTSACILQDKLNFFNFYTHKKLIFNFFIDF